MTVAVSRNDNIFERLRETETEQSVTTGVEPNYA
jgi:hypothetical protein